MAFTINDVGTHRQVNGKLVALTEDERTALRDKWNAPDERPYREKRKEKYPSIGDQLDMLWHAIDTGDWTAAKVKTTDFYTQLKAVKDANPKP